MMNIKISPLMIPLAAFAVIFGDAARLGLAYGIMTLHECAHLIAAVCIGLRPDEFRLSPFGAHLTLKNKIVRSFSDELILYASGPLLNGALALICARAGFFEAYRLNVALMVMNLLPVLPLDGGVIVKRLLSRNIGKKRAENLLTAISVVCAAVFLSGAVYGLITGVLNISMFIMALFFMGNAVTCRELYDVDFIKGISSKKKSNRVRLVAVDDTYTLLDAAGAVSDAYTTAALIKTPEGIKLLSEREIFDRLA